MKVKVTVEAFGRRFKVSAEKTKPADSAPPWEPSPSGSTCGDLSRAETWDHDTRQPLGFAGNIQPMPSPYGTAP